MTIEERERDDEIERLAKMCEQEAEDHEGAARMWPVPRGPEHEKLASDWRKVAEIVRASPVRSESWKEIESAPKDGTHILAWFVSAWPHGPVTERADRAYWTDHNGGGWVTYSSGQPTHWMPLPEPPQ